MARLLTALACIFVLAYAAACGALYVFQRNLIYHPQAQSVRTELIRVHQGSGEPGVLASVREHKGSDAVVYFGGNAEDVSQSMAPLMQAFPNHALYLLHYRGYGGSGGQPTEALLQHDALALFDLVHAQHENVVVIGRSLGTGVAVRLASQRPAVRLVLVTPYDSLADLAARQFPLFPVRWLLGDKFDSWKYVGQVRAPTQIIMAENDETIPRASTERLFGRFAPGRATLSAVPGVSHNTLLQDPRYLALLKGAQ